MHECMSQASVYCGTVPFVAEGGFHSECITVDYCFLPLFTFFLPVCFREFTLAFDPFLDQTSWSGFFFYCKHPHGTIA